MSSIEPIRLMSHSISIRALAKTQDYAARALEAIGQVPRASDPPQLLDRLIGATTALGAAASVYAATIPDDENDSSCFSVFACHPAFARRQSAEGPIHHHPWLRFAQSHTTPGTDHELQLQHASDCCAIALASQYGFKASLIVPTAAGPGRNRIGMLCLGSGLANDFEGDDARVVRTLAHSLAGELHDWVTCYLRDRLKSNAGLHRPDLDLLTMEWQGLGTKEISQRTGLSFASIDSRFQRINARLNCPSRKASARRAAAYGLLETSWPAPAGF